MKNRIVRILLTVIIITCYFNIPLYAKETPDELKELYARSAVLMDADSGRILFGKNEEDVLPMASTTKIMTCILALENMQKEQVGTVSDYAVRQPKVHLGARSGEQFYIEDLLYSLMLESHNDSAVIIAEAISGTVEKFVEMMNEKAKELGCTDTYFITPNGLDAEDIHGVHSTTAKDLALIMRYCINESAQRENFLEITRKSAHQFTDITGKRRFSCNNHNAFLGMMEGALSGKTGFTNNAGYCYVGALKREERTFIVVLLACGWPNNKGYKWKDTRKLMTYAVDNFEYRNVWEDIELEKTAVVNGFDKNGPFENDVFVDVEIADNDREVKVLMEKDEQVDVKIVFMHNVKAPVHRNQKIGMLFYLLEGNIVKSYEIVAIEKIEKRTIPHCFWVVTGCLLLCEG